MITDRLFQPAEEPEPIDAERRIDEDSEKYAELLTAARGTGETYLVAILKDDGLSAWENITQESGDIDRLKTLFSLLAMYVADQISDREGDDAMAAFFAYMVAGVIDG